MQIQLILKERSCTETRFETEAHGSSEKRKKERLMPKQPEIIQKNESLIALILI